MQINKYWNHQDLFSKTGIEKDFYLKEVIFTGKYSKKNNYYLIMNKTLESNFLRKLSHQSKYYFFNSYLKNLNPGIIKNKTSSKNFFLGNLLDIRYQEIWKNHKSVDWKTQKVIRSSPIN